MLWVYRRGMSTPNRDVRVSDARTMRALAHPTRLRLLGTLRVRGPQSVGGLVDLLDEAPGSVSYHLGRLAELGLVVEAPELMRDKREHWWRAAHDRTVFEPLEMLDDPERLAALTALRRAILERYVEQIEAYLRAEPALPPAWVAAAMSSDTHLSLTADELAALRDELTAVLDRWSARSEPGRDGAREVALILHAFPRV